MALDRPQAAPKVGRHASQRPRQVTLFPRPSCEMAMEVRVARLPQAKEWVPMWVVDWIRRIPLSVSGMIMTRQKMSAQVSWW